MVCIPEFSYVYVVLYVLHLNVSKSWQDQSSHNRYSCISALRDGLPDLGSQAKISAYKSSPNQMHCWARPCWNLCSCFIVRKVDKLELLDLSQIKCLLSWLWWQCQSTCWFCARNIMTIGILIVVMWNCRSRAYLSCHATA